METRNHQSAKSAGSIGNVTRRSHRTLVSVTMVSLFVAAVGIPYVVQAATQDSNDQPDRSGTVQRPTSAVQPTDPSNMTSSSAASDQPADAGGSTQAESGNSSTNQTDVKINGQSVAVPQNGSYSKTIDSDGSRTTVQVESEHSNQSSGNSSSNTSSVKLNVRSQSSSESAE